VSPGSIGVAGSSPGGGGCSANAEESLVSGVGSDIRSFSTRGFWIASDCGSGSGSESVAFVIGSFSDAPSEEASGVTPGSWRPPGDSVGTLFPDLPLLQRLADGKNDAAQL
jgi:hypothetical protein